MYKRENLLFVILGCFFLTNALVAEFIGVKIFSLEKTLGLTPASIALFGNEGLSFNLTAGVLLWPVVFVMTDVINEYYGIRGVRILSWMAAVLIAYAFLMVFLSIGLSPADFWIRMTLPGGDELDMETSYNQVFGQGLWIMIASIIAFLFGQLIDAFIFRRIKLLTGEKQVWVRATVSTFVSQFIDSFVVLFIAFYLGSRQWTFDRVMAICIVNYIYKFSIAVVMIPALYFIHSLIRGWLGHETAEKLSRHAIEEGEY